MAERVKILAFAGSTRKASYSKKLLAVAITGAEEAGAEVTRIDLKEYPMPLYDGDLEEEKGLPEHAHKLRELFLAHDGLLMSCPEYNSSISAVWKNTIDWLSRPQPDRAPLDCFIDKFAVMMTASPGQWGGVRAIQEYRKILSNIKVKVLPEQQSVRRIAGELDDDGNLKSEKREEAIKALGKALHDSIAQFKSGSG